MLEVKYGWVTSEVKVGDHSTDFFVTLPELATLNYERRIIGRIGILGT